MEDTRRLLSIGVNLVHWLPDHNERVIYLRFNNTRFASPSESATRPDQWCVDWAQAAMAIRVDDRITRVWFDPQTIEVAVKSECAVFPHEGLPGFISGLVQRVVQAGRADLVFKRVEIHIIHGNYSVEHIDIPAVSSEPKSASVGTQQDLTRAA